MAGKQVYICDCDHQDVWEEEQVFKKNGIPFEWLHCGSPEEVIRQCGGARVLLNQYVKMNEQVFSAMPELKCVVRYGVGVDNVDLEAASRYGVQVCNVPDYGTEEVADQALALMMTLVRKTHETNSLVHDGCWDYRASVPIHRSRGRTVGILGVGRIGSAFAERVRPLGVRILGYDPAYGNPERVFPDFVEFVDLDQLAAESDILSIHCSLNPTSVHLVNEAFLRRMKPGSILINVARGGIVAEDALLGALEEGILAGVGLDVVEKEPLTVDHPLLRHRNVVVSPHIAWYSEESARELKRKCAEEAVRYLKGEALRCPILTV